MPEQTYYDVLGVPPDASEDEIKERWKRLLKYWHPDHNDGPDAEARAKSLNKAHDVLSDPTQRQAYDSQLAIGQPIHNGDDVDWAPAWTPPPGRYSARKSARPRARPTHAPTTAPPPPSRAPGWGTPDGAPDPMSSASGGSTWTHVSTTHYRNRVSRYSRASMAWVAKPLQHPTMTPGFVGTVALRVVVLGGAAALIWFSVPYLIQVVIWVAGVLIAMVLIALVLMFGFAAAGGGSSKKRRGRGKRRR